VRALSIQATENGGTLVLGEVPEPSPDDGELVVEALALGICGTDRELAARAPRSVAPGRSGLVLGHESLGRVLTAPPGSKMNAGDLVVGMVRRPDPIPCTFCAEGQFDLCENGLFTERGISGLDGFGSERFRLEADFAVRVDPALGLAAILLEPASVFAKAWEQFDRIVRRPYRRALVLGAGPIGLLAAVLGQQRGIEVHVVDHVEQGPKPRQARMLGAVYHNRVDGLTGTFDAVLDCLAHRRLPRLLVEVRAPLARQPDSQPARRDRRRRARPGRLPDPVRPPVIAALPTIVVYLLLGD
jgi:threonine dehydrogenase-like Zn-dependent dehydrogenase